MRRSLLIAGFCAFAYGFPAQAQSDFVEMVPDTGQTFKGYDCMLDCTAHFAGYEWAKANTVKTLAECDGGHTNDFAEGCYAFLTEEYPQALVQDITPAAGP